MRIHQRIIGVSVTVATAATLAGCGGSQSSAVKPVHDASSARTVRQDQGSSDAGSGPSSQVIAEGQSIRSHLVKIYEFTTPGGKGYFYTTNPAEAVSAARDYHFTPVKHDLGRISNVPFKGSLALYRLRYKPFSSYLVANSTQERDSLVHSGQFVYEGVMGYVSKSETGKLLLWRVANNCHWRLVTRAESSSLIQQGWHSDGPVGYVWKMG